MSNRGIVGGGLQTRGLARIARHYICWGREGRVRVCRIPGMFSPEGVVVARSCAVEGRGGTILVGVVMA